jgi:hypothetical protein
MVPLVGENAMDVISTINNSISIVSRLREISKNISEAEFKNLLADLSNELADAKILIATLKEQVAALKQENAQLKAAGNPHSEKPTMKWGCYQFDGDTGLYCTACYDTKGKKIQTTRANSKYRMCPVCQAVYGA